MSREAEPTILDVVKGKISEENIVLDDGDEALNLIRDDGGVVLDVDTRTPEEAGADVYTMNVAVGGEGNFYTGGSNGSIGLRIFNGIDTGAQSRFLRGAHWQVSTTGDSSITGAEGQAMRGIHGACVHDSTGTVTFMHGNRISTTILAAGSTVNAGDVQEAVTLFLDPGFASNSGTGKVVDWYQIKIDQPNATSAGSREITNFYGIQIDDLDGLSGVNNAWAIKTGTGKVDFGGSTSISTNHVGSGSPVISLDILTELDSGTQSDDFRGTKIQAQVNGAAISSGTGGNAVRAAHISAVTDSTGTVAEINGLQTNAVIGVQGSSVNVGAVTNATGQRVLVGYSTTGTGSITNGTGLLIQSPNGTSAGTRTITNQVGLLIQDQNKAGVTNAKALKAELATEDFTLDDAGTAAATEQSWVEVTVNGVTGYLRVYAAK